MFITFRYGFITTGLGHVYWSNYGLRLCLRELWQYVFNTTCPTYIVIIFIYITERRGYFLCFYMVIGVTKGWYQSCMLYVVYTLLVQNEIHLHTLSLLCHGRQLPWEATATIHSMSNTWQIVKLSQSSSCVRKKCLRHSSNKVVRRFPRRIPAGVRVSVLVLYSNSW